MQLGDAVVQIVQLGGHGIQLGLDHGAGLVHKVDGLVRQEPVGDIAVGQGGRGNERAVLNFHAVVHLVPFFQAAQDGNGVLHRRLVDGDRLETAFQRRILLNILPVFVQRGGADAVQLAPRQHRLEQVACVHGAVRLARAHDGVQLINEKNDLAFALFHFIEDGFQPFLKLAAVLCACHQRTHVQTENGAILEVFRHIPPHNALGKTLGNGGLANARLTDEDGVVFALAGQDADDIADLAVTANDRIQLVGPGHLHQILPVFFQRIVGGFRVVGGDPLVAAHRGKLGHEFFLGDAELPEQLPRHPAGALEHPQKDVLHADIVVLHPTGLTFGGVEGLIQLIGDVDLFRVASRPGHPWQRLHLLQGCLRKGVRIHVHSGEQLGDQPVILPGQRRQQMLLLDGLIGIFHREALGILDGLDGFLCHLIHVHTSTSLILQILSHLLANRGFQVLTGLVFRILMRFPPVFIHISTLNL